MPLWPHLNSQNLMSLEFLILEHLLTNFVGTEAGVGNCTLLHLDLCPAVVNLNLVWLRSIFHFQTMWYIYLSLIHI